MLQNSRWLQAPREVKRSHQNCRLGEGGLQNWAADTMSSCFIRWVEWEGSGRGRVPNRGLGDGGGMILAGRQAGAEAGGAGWGRGQGVKVGGRGLWRQQPCHCHACMTGAIPAGGSSSCETRIASSSCAWGCGWDSLCLRPHAGIGQVSTTGGSEWIWEAWIQRNLARRLRMRVDLLSFRCLF